MNKTEKIKLFLDNGYLISPDLLENIDEKIATNGFFDDIHIKIKSQDKPIIINKDIYGAILDTDKIFDLNWHEFESSKSELEKGKQNKIYSLFLNILETKEIDLEQLKKQPEGEIDIIQNSGKDISSVVVKKIYTDNPKKRTVQDFVSYYKKRYESVRSLLVSRPDLKNLTSISKLNNKNGNNSFSIIGLVFQKTITKNGNLILEVEDKTGLIKVIINKDREIYENAKDIVEDEIIGVSGAFSNGVMFANLIVHPDIPIKNKKYAPEEAYVAFISDVHIGSKLFLREDLFKFIDWINGGVGNLQQKEMAKKVKYLFVVGDVVDGCGIYPNQDKELSIPDIYKQYEECKEIFSKIRKDVSIIMCPGNHDAVRISEPQPALSKFAEPLKELPNLILTSNPSLVNIHSSEDFPGFDVLMYHGFSFDYYLNNVDCIRKNEGKDNPSVILKYLLQRRHLAPTHSSTLYVPETEEDPLFIEQVPDIFVTGHLHKTSVSNYNNVITVCCSCWQSKTDFQEKCGHNPDPSKVPLLNLKTREVKILKFGK